MGKEHKYKYYKEDINNIIKEYNKIFNPYGFEFKFAHYKLKKR